MILIKPFFLIIFSLFIPNQFNLEKGEILFENYCSLCHQNGNTIFFPEKNLKKETLERNGINSTESIRYLIKNGKNGMPAFGGKVREEEIEQIASYLFDKSQINFK